MDIGWILRVLLNCVLVIITISVVTLRLLGCVFFCVSGVWDGGTVMSKVLTSTARPQASRSRSSKLTPARQPKRQSLNPCPKTARSYTVYELEFD